MSLLVQLSAQQPKCPWVEGKIGERYAGRHLHTLASRLRCLRGGWPLISIRRDLDDAATSCPTQLKDFSLGLQCLLVRQ